MKIFKVRAILTITRLSSKMLAAKSFPNTEEQLTSE